MNKQLRANLFDTIKIDDCAEFKLQVFQWASQFETICYFDNKEYSGYHHNSFEGLIAVGEDASILKHRNDKDSAFEKLKQFWEIEKDWLFGFLSYDLKNEVENLASENFDGLSFPEMHFFKPQMPVASTLLYNLNSP